jgi:serine/threonine protein phosphatase PrpC
MKLFQSAFFEIGKATNPGFKRAGSANQDSIKVIRSLFDWQQIVLVIADGMGGYEGGEVASKCVIKAFYRNFLKRHASLSSKEYLEVSVSQAHQLIRQKAASVDRWNSMGSTVVAAVLKKKELSLINVGDSRLYLLRNGKIQQLSYDQSLVADMVRKGEITKEEARIHPYKNRLTMSITARRNVVASYKIEIPLEFEDVILLCSDGLWGVVPEGYIRAAACQLSPQKAAKRLVDLANSFGGPDNISVIIARRAGSHLEEIKDDEE